MQAIKVACFGILRHYVGCKSPSAEHSKMEITMTIQEMKDELRKCYECTKLQSCLGCPFNGSKLDILQYLTNEMKKQERK